MEHKSTTADLLETLPVSKAYFRLSIPLVLSMVVTIVYGLVDMGFVSATDNVNLIAGVSIIAPVYTLLLAFGDIFGYGAAALIAQALGRKDYLKTKQITSFSFWTALSSGVFVTALLLLLRRPVINLLGADADVFPHAEAYYTWIVMAAPAVLVYPVFLNIMRSVGKAKEAMFAVLLGTVVNLILDPVFIFVMNMGAAGASLSTFIGMTVEAVACLLIGVRGSEILSISPDHVRLDGGSIRRLLSVGFSASLTNAVQTFMLVVTNLYLIRYSFLAVSAMGIVQKVSLISYLLLLGFALGAQPLLGCAYGAEDRPKMREILAYGTKVCLAVAAALTLIIEVFAPQIMSLFISDTEIVSMGSAMMRIQYVATVFLALVLVLFSLAISVGDARVPFILSVTRQGIIFLAAIAILSAIAGYYGVISAQPAADILTAVLALFLYRRRIRAKIR